MDILRFIKNFKENNPEAIEDCFMNGNCYWFARILKEATEYDIGYFSGYIMYDPVLNHFYFYFTPTYKYYDIRGEVHPDPKDLVIWEDYCYKEILDAGRVFNNCILKGAST